MVKSFKNSSFVLMNLSEIRNTSKIILQMEDTHTQFTDGQKCYLCEVVDSFVYNITKNKDDLIMEICNLNNEKRKLERKISRLEKALKECQEK
jgi:division protein CdvB (Snf7/Vps24/ESCRT-III family)